MAKASTKPSGIIEHADATVTRNSILAAQAGIPTACIRRVAYPHNQSVHIEALNEGHEQYTISFMRQTIGMQRVVHRMRFHPDEMTEAALLTLIADRLSGVGGSPAALAAVEEAIMHLTAEPTS